MDTPHRHEAVDYARMMVGIAAIVIAIFFGILVCWLVLSEPKTKLYEADSVVCVQGPFVSDCWERKPR